MHLSIYSPTTPLGIIWGNIGDLTYLDVKFPTVGQTEYVKSPIYPGHTYNGVFRGKFALGPKGSFYAKLFFMSKGKMLRHHCLYVRNGKTLRQTSLRKTQYMCMHMQIHT